MGDVKEPPVWWKQVLFTAWAELRRANKGLRRQARKIKLLSEQLTTLQAEKARLEGELGRQKPIIEAAELYYLAMQACEKSGNDGADVNDATDSLNSLLFCAALYFDPTQEPTTEQEGCGE